MPLEAFYFSLQRKKKIVLISGPCVGGAKKIVMTRKGDGVHNSERTGP